MRGLSSPMSRGILLPRPGVEPASPALEGGFFLFFLFKPFILCWVTADVRMCLFPVLDAEQFLLWTFQVGLVVKNMPVNAGDIETQVQPLGQQDPLGGGHGNPLQYSCLENPIGR